MYLSNLLVNNFSFMGQAPTQCRRSTVNPSTAATAVKMPQHMGREYILLVMQTTQHNPTYFRADGVGIRCMYLARVLVGLSVIGSSSMVEPPQLPGGNGRTYDSTCDQEASIFVVYHDAQAYPEYLIEFQ